VLQCVQCVAVCCSVLQCVAVCCSVLLTHNHVYNMCAYSTYNKVLHTHNRVLHTHNNVLHTHNYVLHTHNNVFNVCVHIAHTL